MAKKEIKRHETQEIRAEMLGRIAKLEGPNYFTEAVNVPSDLAAAIITSRPELLRAVRPKALTVEECDALYKVLSTLIETNMALREHANEVAQMAKNMMGGFTTIQRVGEQIAAFASFNQARDED